MKRLSQGCPPPTAEELQDRWQRWTQAMELSHEMLMARLRSELTDGEDIHEAYRRWYANYQNAKWDDDQWKNVEENSTGKGP